MVVLLTKLADINGLMRVAEVQDTFMATIYQRGRRPALPWLVPGGR
jgi:hypothetical protein